MPEDRAALEDRQLYSNMAFLIGLTAVLFQNEAKLMDELQASLEKQYVDQLEKAQEQWKEDEIRRINDELQKQKEQLLKVSIILQLLLFSMRRVL